MKIRIFAEADVTERLGPLITGRGWELEVTAPGDVYPAGKADAVLVSVMGEGGIARLQAVHEAEGDTVELVALARRGSIPDMQQVIASGATELITVDSPEPVIMARLAFLESRVRRLERTHFRGVPLDTVLDCAGDAVEIVDAEVVIQYVNPAFERIMGYRRADAIGRTPKELVASGMHSAEFFADMFATMARGDTWRGVLISRRKDGQLIHLDTTLAAVFDRRGRITHRVAVKRDITEHLAQEKRLRESEERHRLALRGTNEILFDWDIAEDRLRLSARFWELLQLPLPEAGPAAGYIVEMETWLRRLHPADSAATRRLLEEALEDPSRSRFEAECRLLDSRGEARWMLVRGILLRPDASLPSRMAGSMADITSLKRAHEELERTRDQAVAASIAKSQFLANMSHELRTPLNAIIGYSEMLIEDAQDPADADTVQRRSDLQRIHSAGRMLLDLINDILDISKIEAGRMELHLELIELQEVLEVVAASILPATERSGNRFEVHLPERLEAVRCDATKLRQVLLNLCSNANKFTQRGSIVLEVRQDEVHTRFRVRDSGIGIAPEVLPRLFQPFVQGDASTTRRYGGTGLGLAISRRLCRLMGGDLTVESQLAVGSTFEAIVPRHIQEGAAELEEPPAADAPPDAPVVLVIDDDGQTQKQYAEALREAGFAPLLAHGGGPGLAVARERHPDVIVLDLMMPDMSGFDVLSALKADPATVGIPVVMASMASEAERAFALGASEYLLKPVDREQLLGVLGRYRRPRAPRPLLLVEDDADTAEMMRRLLVGSGWEVRVAVHGVAALALLEGWTPDVVLLDLMLPEMDGFELLGRLREREQTRAVPVVVVTAKELSQDERQLLARATHKVLHKGQFQLGDLMVEIERALARGQGGG